MVKFNVINHLAMATRDMDKTILFWRDLLGMRLVAGLGHPGYRHYFFQISGSDLIAFFEWLGTEPVAKKEHGRPVKGPFTFDHVSFGVESEDDLWELKDKLEAAGFHVSDTIDHPPSPVTLEGAELQTEAWPEVETPTPALERVMYPGAGSQLFQGKKTL